MQFFRSAWDWLLRSLGMWALLISVCSGYEGFHSASEQYNLGGWQHARIGRGTGGPDCEMCIATHLAAAHGISVYRYSDALAPHWAAHHPSVVKPKKLVTPRLPFEPTPESAVRGLVDLVKPRSSDLIVDPGCGDARLLIALCKDSDAHGIGYEINLDIASLALKQVKAAGLADRIKIWNVDCQLVSLTGASVVVMYLTPKLIRELDYSKARIALSYQHPIGGSQQVGNWYVKRRKSL